MNQRSLELTRQIVNPANAREFIDQDSLNWDLRQELTRENRQGDLEPIEACANAQLLLNFTRRLPEAETTKTWHGIRSSFTATTPEAEQAIQSAVVWLRTWSGSVESSGTGGGAMAPIAMPGIDFVVRPYWMLGKKAQNHKDIQFLLAPASYPRHRSEETPPYVNSPVRRFLERTATSHLVVMRLGKTAGTRLDDLYSRSDALSPLFRDSVESATDIDHKSKNTEVVTMHARRALRHVRPAEGVTDQQLAAYGVVRRLEVLARVFGQKDELTTLLNAHSENNQSDLQNETL
ncbi:MAG: hypothetical protein WA843_02420 [Candidatus Saccharimonadales bacterium]